MHRLVNHLPWHEESLSRPHRIRCSATRSTCTGYARPFERGRLTSADYLSLKAVACVDHATHLCWSVIDEADELRWIYQIMQRNSDGARENIRVVD